MALANSTLITVTATYTRLDGRAASGQVFFSSNQVLVNSTSGEIVPPVDFVATLDANGAISIDLPATDDPDYEPQGWTYTVTEDTDGGDRPPFGLSVPADGGSIDLADVAPPGPTESLTADEYTLLSTFTSHRSAWGGDPPAGSADDLLGLDANNVPKVIPDDTYASRWATEISEFTGDLGDRIQAAHDALPVEGGVIDARFLDGASTTTATAITLTKRVKILFGAYTFNCVGIAVNTGYCVLEGVGTGLSEVRSDSADVLTFDDATFLACERIKFHSVAGGGHVVKDIGAASGMNWLDVILDQDNDGKACYYLDDTGVSTGGEFIDNQFVDVWTEHTSTATVASWHLRGNAVTRNRWVSSRPTYSGNYVWLIESTATSSYANENVIEGVNGEIVTGGLVKILGGEGNRVSDVGIYDLEAVGPAQRDLIVQGAAANVPSQRNEYSNIRRHGGSLAAGVSDFKQSSGQSILDNCGGATSMVADFGSLPAIARLSALTVSNGSKLKAITVAGHPESFRADDRPPMLGAADMAGVFGSPAIVRVGSRWDAMALDDASTEQIAGRIDMPASWSTYDLEVWHTTLTGNAGDVRIHPRLLAPAAGETLAAQDESPSAVTLTAVGTAETLGVTTMLTGVTARSGINLVHLERVVGSADDTLTGDWLVVALVLRRAS